MAIVKFKRVRLFFPALLEASEYKGRRSYNAKFGIEPGGVFHNAIEAAILEVATDKWGKKAADRIKQFSPIPQQYPYRSGDSVGWEGAEGNMVLTATKQEKSGKPLVLSNIRYGGDDYKNFKGKFIEIHDEKGTPYGRDENGKLVELDDCTDEITTPYSGCYVNASVEFWAQDGDNSGIRCALRGVQFCEDGDAFAGGSKARADEFDELADGADGEDFGSLI